MAAREGRRGGEWWESPEGSTLGDQDQQRNKNRPSFCPPGNCERGKLESVHLRLIIKPQKKKGMCRDKGALWKIAGVLPFSPF